MTVVNGVLTQLSVSEVESFDPKQNGGCNRRWWFERAMDLRPDQDDAQSDGQKGHALLAAYLADGTMPEKRVKLSKAVTGAILKGELPKPGPDLIIEQRFSEQEARDVNGDWIPLDTSATLWLGGVPWDGFIDLAFRRGPIPEIWDHKFSSDIHTFAKKSSDLIKTVQLPVYVLSQIPYWPDAKTWRIAHHNVSRKGVDSFIRSAIVALDQVYERREAIEQTVYSMRELAGATSQDDVPATVSTKSCDAWGGCPHQSICSAYRKKATAAMTLSPTESALFDGINMPTEDTTPAPTPAQMEPTKPPRRHEFVDVELTPEQEATARENMARVEADNAVHAAILPPDAPVSKPELAAETVAAVPPPKERKKKAPPALTTADLMLPAIHTPPPAAASPQAELLAEPVLTSTPGPVVTVQAPPAADVVTMSPRPTVPMPPALLAPLIAPHPMPSAPRAMAIAQVLESIAALIRAA